MNVLEVAHDARKVFLSNYNGSLWALDKIASAERNSSSRKKTCIHFQNCRLISLDLPPPRLPESSFPGNNSHCLRNPGYCVILYEIKGVHFSHVHRALSPISPLSFSPPKRRMVLKPLIGKSEEEKSIHPGNLKYGPIQVHTNRASLIDTGKLIKKRHLTQLNLLK